MAKKVKSYQKNMKTVIKSVEKATGVKVPDASAILDKLPPETVKEMTDSISKSIGGDMFATYISEFMNIFKTIAFNTEMNTAGISALANNIKYFYSTLEGIEKKQNEILKLLKGLNAK